MEPYILSADFLNKFSQLTPWVQVLLGAMLCGVAGLSIYWLGRVAVTFLESWGGIVRIERL